MGCTDFWAPLYSWGPICISFVSLLARCLTMKSLFQESRASRFRSESETFDVVCLGAYNGEKYGFVYKSTLFGSKGIFYTPFNDRDNIGLNHQSIHRSFIRSTRALVCPWYRVSWVSWLSSAFVFYAYSMTWTSFLCVHHMLAMVIILTYSPSWSASFVLLLLFLPFLTTYCSTLDILISSSISPNLPSLDITQSFTSVITRVWLPAIELGKFFTLGISLSLPLSLISWFLVIYSEPTSLPSSPHRLVFILPIPFSIHCLQSSQVVSTGCVLPFLLPLSHLHSYHWSSLSRQSTLWGSTELCAEPSLLIARFSSPTSDVVPRYFHHWPPTHYVRLVHLSLIVPWVFFSD